MESTDPNEPLFTLTSDDKHPSIALERRAEAYGYGLKVLENAFEDTEDVDYCVHWIISQSLQMVDRDDAIGLRRAKNYNDVMDRQALYSRLLKAGQFLFATEHIDISVLKSLQGKSFSAKCSSKVNGLILMAVLIAFARVEATDLEHCRDLPLSLFEYDRIRRSQHKIDNLDFEKGTGKGSGKFDICLSVLDGFTIISRLLLGHMYTEEYVEDAVLISAWGWIVFFDCMDCIDPADVSADRVRILCGVPTRRGLRRTRIIDGLTGPQRSPSATELRIAQHQFRYFPGISTAQKGAGFGRASRRCVSSHATYNMEIFWKRRAHYAISIQRKTHTTC